MKRKNGFTLIELLAVIVILAIIALIATPLVLKYIEKSRKESKVDSAYSFVRNLETEIANYSIKKNGKKFSVTPASGDYYIEDDFKNNEVDTAVKGENPNSIKVCISSLGQVEKGIFEFNDGKYYVSYDGKKGSISGKDTYDSFSCSGNVGTVEPIFTGNVVYEEGASMAYPSTCIDPAEINLGEYYNFILTDASGNINTYKFIAQNSSDEATTVSDELSIIFTHPSEILYYGVMPKNNMCLIINDFDADENPIYNGEYLLEIVPTGEVANPNYVFRIGEIGDKLIQLSYISSDLKSGDIVEFEILDSTSKEVIETLTEEVGTHLEITDFATIYSKQKFKRALATYYTGVEGATDINVIVNGKKIHSFKKEEFSFIEGCMSPVSGCIGDAHYYVGNEDIASVEGC